jgi:hypothetical protein
MDEDIVLTVFDLGRFVAELGRLIALLLPLFTLLTLLTLLLLWTVVATSLGRREVAVDRDGSVAERGVTLSRSEYFSGAYL